MHGCRQIPEKYGYFSEAEVNASGITQYELGLNEGNTSGIAWIQANPGKYGYFSEAEVNASGITQYELGLNEGNTSGIAWVQANPGNYQYFSEADVNASLTVKYELGFADGNLTGSILVAEEIENLKISSAEDGGRAQAIATVQAEFAREKLSFVPYEQEMVESIPYTVGWFHVPAVGWMWTTPGFSTSVSAQ